MMTTYNTVGFPISDKENEKRIALVPMHLSKITNCNKIFLERGYGSKLGYSDEEYSQYGVNICERNEILACDIICDPKIGDAKYLKDIHDKGIFGWVHAVQNRHITDILLNNKLVAYAWEDMYYMGRHLFWRNNQIAGEAAVWHAFMLSGNFPYEANVAVIGRGNTGNGALKALYSFGAKVTTYDRNSEKLLREEIGNYDAIVNCVLWDTTRKDHIIYKDDLKRMKKGSIIIDISCDRNGGVETCIPTSFENPTYVIDGILHYAVDHTPTLFFKSTSNSISEVVSQYIDKLIENNPDEVLNRALITENGVVIDQRINKFQNR